MCSIPAGQAAAAGFIRKLFPEPDRAGLVVRQLQPPDSPVLTVFYLEHLVDPADLERLLLAPLAAGALTGAPADLARSGRFPAPILDPAADAASIRERLLDGLAGLHLDGYPAVLLIGSGQSVASEPVFGHDLDANRIALCRCLRREDLVVEELRGADGSRPLLVYLKSKAAPPLLQAVRQQIDQVTADPGRLPGYQALIRLFRLPPVTECQSPPLAAGALRLGHVAILTEQGGGPFLTPTSLGLLLRGPKDLTLQPYVQRLLVSLRALAAFLGMTLAAWLIAITAYHLAVVPGPFLMAVAVSRQNMPFPITAEMFLVSFAGDLAEAVAVRTGGQRVLLLAWIGAILTHMAGMQVGVVGAISGMTAIAAMILRLTLPNETLRRTLRSWRYLFMLAGAALGVYGISLLGFAMFVYLGHERAFGQVMRLSPDEVAQ